MNDDAGKEEEVTPEVAAAPEPKQEAPKPENPVDAIREQILQHVPDEHKPQVAALVKSLLEFSTPSAPKREHRSREREEESMPVQERYEGLPFKPRVVREARKAAPSTYGNISGT